MTIQELIDKLNKVQKEHGNIDVILEDEHNSYSHASYVRVSLIKGGVIIG